MKAALLEEFGRLRLDSVPDPEPREEVGVVGVYLPSTSLGAVSPSNRNAGSLEGTGYLYVGEVTEADMQIG